MHEDGAPAERGQPLGVQAELARILLGRGAEAAAGAGHALALDAEHHDGVGPAGQDVVERVGDVARPGLHAHRQEGRRGDERHPGPQEGEQSDVGAGHPRVEDVADDRHVGPVEAGALRGREVRSPVEVAAQREGVQEGLRGVLVGAVARVEDRHVDPSAVGEPLRCARRPVADDERLGAHGHDGLGGVLQGLPLGEGGPSGGEGDDVGGESLGRRFEGQAGARRVLEEGGRHGASAQDGQLLDRAPLGGGHVLGRVQERGGLGAREVADRQEVAHVRTPRCSRSRRRLGG